MIFTRIAVLVALAASLAGCELNEKSFNETRVKVRGHTDIIERGIKQCAGRIKYEHIEVKRYMAGYAHTKLDSNFPDLICRRMLKGYLSGRMKYSDFRALQKGKFTPTMTAIVRY
jgi:hypothetical protein